MTRATTNLICDELPGTEKVAGPEGQDLWTIAHEPFVRVGDTVEVRTGAGWDALPPMNDHDLRERIVDSYQIVRKSLPKEVRVTLDRTSG